VGLGKDTLIRTINCGIGGAEMGLFDFIKRKTPSKAPMDDVRSAKAFTEALLRQTAVKRAVVNDSWSDGSSAKRAVIINTTSRMLGIAAEYAYVESVCGERDMDWQLECQSLIEQDGEWFDLLSIAMKNGTCREFWFNISAFHGR